MRLLQTLDQRLTQAHLRFNHHEDTEVREQNLETFMLPEVFKHMREEQQLIFTRMLVH